MTGRGHRSFIKTNAPAPVTVSVSQYIIRDLAPVASAFRQKEMVMLFFSYFSDDFVSKGKEYLPQKGA